MRDREPSLILIRWATPVNVSRFDVGRPPTSGHECRGTGHRSRHLDWRLAAGDGRREWNFAVWADGWWL